MPHAKRIPVHIRPARTTDAPAINALYRESYWTPDGPDALCQYPFAQFFDRDWVAHAVEQDLVCWIVAEIGGHVIATAGAVRNIGTEADRVAEGFGLVVAKKARNRGIGTELFESLCEQLKHDTHFIIGETRTASPGGLCIVRHCGFEAMGFEPFAHTTPVGSESMLLTGKISEAVRSQRILKDKSCSSHVQGLAHRVLKPAGLQPLPHTSRGQSYPIGDGTWKSLRPNLVPVSDAKRDASLPAEGEDLPVEVARDDLVGADAVKRLSSADPHASGLVSLHRLEGEDIEGNRYDRRYYVARVGGQVVGGEVLACVRLVWDRLDRRLRILELQTMFHGLQGVMLAHILEQVEREAGGQPLAVVVDVRADAVELQATLESLGFFVTVYYPGLIAAEQGRMDAVQYTRLYQRRLEDSLESIEAQDWPAARAVISHVTAS